MKSKTPRPDYVYVTYINTTPQKLWAALTSSALTPQYWLGRTCTSTWKRGADIQTFDDEGELEWAGKIVESRPPRRLAYSFQMTGRNQPMTLVTFDLENLAKDPMLSGKGVKLTVTHAGFAADSRQFRGISWGWPIILSGLKSLLETGRATMK